MTEAEIAALVAKAIADHHAERSWGEELLHNAETIVTLLIAGVAGVAVVVRAFHKTDKRVQSLEDYRQAHDDADKAAHGNLEREIGGIGAEVRAFREESSAQHKDLAGQVKSMARDLNRLIGFHEAKEGRE